MAASARTRVLLVDAHPISLAGLHTILDGCQDLQVAGAAQDLESAAVRYRELEPDVVVINTHAHAAEAADSAAALSRCHPPLPAPNILVLVNDVDEAYDQVFEAGVRGLLSSGSDSQELAAAVRLVATGRSLLVPTARREPGDSPLGQLTVREAEVFHLVTRGFSNAEISEELTLSQSTVKSHIQKVMEKLGLRNRVHAVIFAYEKNLIHERSWSGVG